jgi:hypothetical protein
VAMEMAPSSQHERVPATILLSSDEHTQSCLEEYLPTCLYLYLYDIFICHPVDIITIHWWPNSAGTGCPKCLEGSGSRSGIPHLWRWSPPMWDLAPPWHPCESLTNVLQEQNKRNRLLISY